VLSSLLGCQNAPEPAAPLVWLPDGEASVGQSLVAPFSGAHVVETAQRLVSQEGDSASGEDLAQRRGAIMELLSALGVPNEEWLLASASDAVVPDADTPTSTPLNAVVGVLDGGSDDLLLLLAGDEPSDRGGVALDPIDRVSGTAALLELARVLAARPRPYGVWLGFLDDSRPDAALDFEASELFLEELARRGVLPRVRLVVLFGSLLDPDLRIDRDLRSHRVHRETFWESARALGLEDVFSRDAPFGSPESAHVVWLAGGFRNVVAIVGEPSSRSSEARTQEDTTAEIATRLDEFGVVVLDTLARIAARFEGIDGFAKSPLTSERWEDVLPTPDVQPAPAPVP
jgi:hypothetical protein